MSARRQHRQHAAAQRKTRQPADPQDRSSSGARPRAAGGAGLAPAWWIVPALVLLTVGAYASVRHFDFVNFDDQLYVTDNPHVRAGFSWAAVAWAFGSSYAANWHPLTWVSHMLDVEFFGLNPGPHHVVNLIWHVANTVLVWLVLRRLTGSTYRSAIVAAVFGVHPLHVESVAWVAERKDVLSAFFGLLTIWFYAGYVQRPAAWRYATALLLFVLGLMSKPMLVTLPFVLLLLDVWPLGRTRLVAAAHGGTGRAPWGRLILEKVPFLAAAAASSVATFVVQQHAGAVATLEAVAPAARLTNTFISYVMWAWTTLWPRDLAALYPRPDSPQYALAVASLLALIVTTGLVIWKGKRYPYLPVGWMWFVGMLVPVSGLVQIGVAARADRYMYLPVLGLLFAAVWGIADLGRHWRVARPALIGAAITVILVLAAATRVQAGYWRNGLVLWQHALEVTTNNSRAHANLGTSLAEIGRHAEAADEDRKAIAIEPNMPQAHNNLGLALAATGHVGDAIEEYKKAIALLPTYAAAHNNLGGALMDAGELEEAAGQYALALRGRPDDAQIHHNLGAALAMQGHLPEAVREFLEAVRLEPGRAEFHFALGITYAQQGEDAEAIAQLKTALALNPAHDGARRALAELQAPPTGRGRGGRGGR